MTLRGKALNDIPDTVGKGYAIRFGYTVDYNTNISQASQPPDAPSGGRTLLEAVENDCGSDAGSQTSHGAGHAAKPKDG